MIKKTFQSSEFKSSDWFGDVKYSTTNLSQSLLQLKDGLERKKQLIDILLENLIGNAEGQFDRVTLLGEKTKSIKKSIHGVVVGLAPDKPEHWFRKPVAINSGPMSRPFLALPVLPQYDPSLTDELAQSLRRSWIRHEKAIMPSYRPEHSLWAELLLANWEFNQISHIFFAGQKYNLHKIPLALMNDFGSVSLMDFMGQLQIQLGRIREELNELYRILWQKTHQFWEYQKNNLNLKRNARSRASDSEKSYTQLKRISLNERQALDLMGFSEIPDRNSLRLKYKELALRCHPDRNGGDDSGFKKLHSAYQILTKLSQKHS